MKILLIVIVSFVIIEAKERWIQHHVPGNRRGNNYDRGPPWGYPQQIQQNNILSSDVEWVCQNPRSNDIVIYTSRI